ncbi:MAG: hypothetical protein SXA11_06780 [Cyanobacteriota bacterium]|nr:hypothetical protein [Cyanobacteriota bacterium]
MIGLALIDRTIAAIEAEIKQKNEEKQALMAIGQELNPFVTRIKALCLQIPNHKKDILALIASELDLSVTKPKTRKKTQSNEKVQSPKQLPFQVGDRVSNGIIEFEIKDIRSRGIGWQIFDEDGNTYPSSAVEKIPLKEAATENNSQKKAEEKSATTQTEEKPQEKKSAATAGKDSQEESATAGGNSQEESAVPEQKSATTQTEEAPQEDSVVTAEENSQEESQEEKSAATTEEDSQKEKSVTTETEEDTQNVDPEQEDIFSETGFKVGDCVWCPHRGRGTGKVIGFEDHGTIGAKVVVDWEYGNNGSYWSDALKLQKKESSATAEEDSPEEPTEISDTQSQKTPTEDSDLISQAIAALNTADWKPNWIDYQKGSTSLGDDGEECILMISDGNQRKGFIRVRDGSFCIGYELSENTYLENIKSTLSEIAPIWEKKPKAPLQNGINPGKGIKKDFQALMHDDLMDNRLYINNFSKAEWIEFANLAGIEEPVGTKKQIANAICEVYQKAYKESLES